jgi:Xaa-Pro dipeptidase
MRGMPQPGSHFSMGPGTFRVPMSMHAASRRRLVERLRRRGVAERAVVLLQGGVQPSKYDTDRELLFEQESCFQYLFGVKEPGFYGTLEVATGRATLFMPRLPPEWAVWMGQIHPPSHFEALYEVDEVRYADTLEDALRGMKADVLLLLHGRNEDSGRFAEPARFAGLDGFRTDKDALYPELVECRLVKSEDEIALLRYVNAVSSAAHVSGMRLIQPGLMEYRLEANFLHEIYARGGARFSAYTGICGCGPHSAILHYGHQGAPNDAAMRDGELFLTDCGAQYHGYASDVTCTYPVNGRFSPEQRAVYETVLRANTAVQAAMKPGVAWPDMHRLAVRTIAAGLLDIGLVTGSVEELLANHVPALFMPHGLGHLMGLDVHDPGGYPEGVKRIDEPGIRSLRCGRDLVEGMVITVEPGIYFIDAMLEPALGDPKTARFLNAKTLERFRRFGGVRIEDDVLVSKDGADNLTHVPRTVDEIESVMKGAPWSPKGEAVTA